MSDGDRFFKIVAMILLVFTLVVSWSALNAIRSTRQQVQNLQGELHSLRSQVSHEVNSIRGTVQSMRDEARWYTVPSYDVARMDGTTAVVRLSWNMQEYEAGSEVTLYYRYGEDDSFSPVEAVEEGGGLFAVEIPIQLELEPIWYLSASGSPPVAVDGRQAVVEVEEKRVWGEEHSSMQLDYYLAWQSGETLRSSDRHVADLQKLSYDLFNALDLHVRWGADGEISAMLQQVSAGQPTYELHSIVLESRRGGTEVVERWPLNEVVRQYPQMAPARPVFELAAAFPEQEYEALYVVLQYSRGLEIEKEIPPFAYY